MMDYCNGVFTTSIMRNISGGDIRCPCRRCKNKKFLHPYIVTMYLLQKKGLWRITCVGMYTESYLFIIRAW
jgi:hypothetical protein